MINKKGFSFLELMIVIAIAGIMTAAMMVSMNAQRDRKAVEAAAREVATIIRETQTHALTGKDLRNHSNCNFIFNWAISNNINYGVSECRIQSYSLKNGVIFSNSGSFFFSVPFAVLNITSNVDIVLNKNSSTYHICVYTSGLVKESLSGC